MAKTFYRNTFKRWLDLLIAIPALLLLLPVLLAVAAAVRLRLGSPVIFRQERPGLDGQTFTVFKVRTMTDERGEDGKLRPDSERLTRLGACLRRTSLDELPQLWNVVRGDMSLVGPRPMRLDYFPYFTPREQIRHTVRPGITGWAQIHGRNEVSWDQRFAYDVWYVEHLDLSLDLRILLATVWQAFGSKGVIVDPGSVLRDLSEVRAHMLLPTGQFEKSYLPCAAESEEPCL